MQSEEIENLPKGLASFGAMRIGKKLRSISSGRVLGVATGNGGFIDTLMKALKDYDSFVGIDISRKKWNLQRSGLKGNL